MHLQQMTFKYIMSNFSFCHNWKEVDISKIQNICSRWLWRHLGKKIKIALYQKCNITWIVLKILWQKGNMFIMSNCSICYKVCTSCLLQMQNNASVCEKEWKQCVKYFVNILWTSAVEFPICFMIKFSNLIMFVHDIYFTILH